MSIRMPFYFSLPGPAASLCPGKGHPDMSLERIAQIVTLLLDSSHSPIYDKDVVSLSYTLAMILASLIDFENLHL